MPAATADGFGAAPGLGLPEMLPSQAPEALPARPTYAGSQAAPAHISSSLFGGAAPGLAPGLPASPANPHTEIARDIGQQVEVMIMQAKRANETKVAQEIGKIKAKMEALSKKIGMVTERLNGLEGTTMWKADLQKSIAKLEEVWEGEVGTLKHELWQTIQAHNHNADLMKTHKDAIDRIQAQTSESRPQSPELEQVSGQLSKVDTLLQREQAKHQQIDQLIQRFQVFEHQLNAGAALGAGSWSGPPGVHFPMPGMPQATPAANHMQPAGKKVPKKGASNKTAKAKSTAALTAAAAAAQAGMNLRAEAPEFVPTTGGWEGGL